MGDAVVAVPPLASTLARRVLAAKSKSFALAARLLPPESRDDVAVLYAWCRYADDAIDLTARSARAAALARLRRELDRLCAGELVGEAVIDAFGELARRKAIPRAYPEALLDGFAMDVASTRHETLEELLLYCFRVAGVVGAMMCHVIGLSDASALRPAVHLGVAMQLTNVCRDVAEDAADGRVYLPSTLLRVDPAALIARPADHVEPVASTVALLLSLAELYYRSADRGRRALPLRAAFAVRTARMVYATIGDRLARASFDPLRGRAFVPLLVKLWLVLRALLAPATELPARARRRLSAQPLGLVRYPDDVLR